MSLQALGTNYSAAAILTWVAPVVLFLVTVAWLFFQRRRP